MTRPTNSPASRPHAKRPSSRRLSRCVNFNSLNRRLPVVLQFDYHLLLMAIFSFELTDAKSKATKPDAKFNWKSFYFLVCLIGLCLNTTSGALVSGLSDDAAILGGKLGSELDSKPDGKQNRSDSKPDSLTDSAFVPAESRQPGQNLSGQTEYRLRTISDQQPNQTSAATYSTYQIFNDQTSDRPSINLEPKQTPDSTNQTRRTASSTDKLSKSCHEWHLCLPTNRTIRPSLITVYTAERQDSRAPPERNGSRSGSLPAGQPVASLLDGANLFRTEMESKMRRRFVADNSDPQKGLNEEDSKNYNQKKRDKMQKMQNYEQQVRIADRSESCRVRFDRGFIRLTCRSRLPV